MAVDRPRDRGADQRRVDDAPSITIKSSTDTILDVWHGADTQPTDVMHRA